jgi:tetratricopeptide (TPR) repeat protein
VPLSSEGRASLLERARELYGARDYPGLVELLLPLEAGELLETPVLGFYLADAWQRGGERARALSLLAELAPVCARRGNDLLYRDRLNLEGVILFGLGRIEEAEDAWRRLLSAATRAGDDNFDARANNNLGVIYTLLGDREAALASYARAITAYQRLGYVRGLAQAHQNQAITYREMDLWREAEHHFQRAIDYALADGSADENARARQERSLLLCYQGQRGLAALTARHALREWERLDNPAGVGDSHRVLGTIALAGRDWDRARAEAEEGLGFARRLHDPLLEAESCELLATVAVARDAGAGAEPLRSRAEELFASMGAGAWGSQLRQRLRWLSGEP